MNGPVNTVERVGSSDASEYIELEMRDSGDPPLLGRRYTFPGTELGKLQMQATVQARMLLSKVGPDGKKQGISGRVIQPSPGDPKTKKLVEESLVSLRKSIIRFGFVDGEELASSIPRSTNRMLPDPVWDNLVAQEHQRQINVQAEKDLNMIEERIRLGLEVPVVRLEFSQIDESIIRRLGELIRDPATKMLGNKLDVRVDAENERTNSQIMRKFGTRFATKRTKQQALARLQEKAREKKKQEQKPRWSILKPRTWLKFGKRSEESTTSAPAVRRAKDPILQPMLNSMGPKLRKLTQQVQAGAFPHTIKLDTPLGFLTAFTRLYALSQTENGKDLKIMVEPMISTLLMRELNVEIPVGQPFLVRELGDLFKLLKSNDMLLPTPKAPRPRVVRQRPSAPVAASASRTRTFSAVSSLVAAQTPEFSSRTPLQSLEPRRRESAQVPPRESDASLARQYIRKLIDIISGNSDRS